MQTPALDKLLNDLETATSVWSLSGDLADFKAGAKELAAWKEDVEKRLAALEAK